jgi:hypothetical protein
MLFLLRVKNVPGDALEHLREQSLEFFTHRKSVGMGKLEESIDIPGQLIAPTLAKHLISFKMKLFSVDQKSIKVEQK